MNVILPGDVINTAARLFSVTPDEIRGSERHQHLSFVRLAAMAATRDLTGLGYKAVAYEFGGRDHTCVINACQRRASHPTINRYAKEITEAVLANPVPAGWIVSVHCACGWSLERVLPDHTTQSITGFVDLVTERNRHREACTAAEGEAA